MAPPRIPPANRLEANSKRVGACLLWTGPKTKDGYGAIGIGRKQYRAHRVAYTLAHGLIGEGLLVCHRCDTPLCIEPDHLFVGTPRDNTRDMHAKGRMPIRRGAAHHATKILPEQRPVIRARREAGETLKQIAADYGVCFQVISAICRKEKSYGAA